MEEKSQTIMEQVMKLCGNLKSQDKNIRRDTFMELLKTLSSEQVSSVLLHDIFKESYVYMLNGLRDPSETVRSHAIKLLSFIVGKKLELSDYYLSYIFPVLVERIGTPELIESSEEIRLELLQLLNEIILKYSGSEQLRPFSNDITLVLSEAVKDKHPEVKMLACKCITNCSKALPMDFHLQAEALVKPVLTAFSYQRFRIRVEAIDCMGLLQPHNVIQLYTQCLGPIIMHSTYKGIEQVVQPMAERLFDQVPIVRQTVAKVAAFWMKQHRDRYSFFAKLLPLVLTGLNDEVPETRLQSQTLWREIGEQYQKENESELKDQIDFQYELPKYYPTNLERPSLGCRILVQRNVSKIAPAIASELGSWQTDVKIRCAQLLCAIALHAEDKLTQHMQQFLPAMYLAARDDDQRVVINVCQASYYMGLFVPASTWCKLILPAIDDSPNFGNLMVLASLIDGCPEINLREISPKLADNYICFSRKPKYQRELINCVKVITKKTEFGMEDVGYDLFRIIVAVYALRDVDNTAVINFSELVESLRVQLEITSINMIWRKYLNHILRSIHVDTKSWTLSTYERCIFETLLNECGIIYICVEWPLLLEILKDCLDTDADPESKLKILIALSNSLESDVKVSEENSQFFQQLVADIFLKDLVWRAGRVAEALRTATLACLCSTLTLVKQIEIEWNGFQVVFEQIIPLLISLMEDAASKSRQFALRALVILKQIAIINNCWTIEYFAKIYPEMLKRLDDPTSAVREAAIESFTDMFQHVPQQFITITYASHFDFILDTLFIHCDADNCLQLEQLIVIVLKMLANIDKDRVSQRLKQQKNLMRNEQLYSDLMHSLVPLTLNE